MDLASVIGLVGGILAVFGGGMLEGIPLKALLQINAFVIVIVGSVSAMLLSTPVSTLVLGSKMIKDLFFFNSNQAKPLADQIIAYATTARKENLLFLEKSMDSVPHPFLKRTLRCALDGLDPETLTEIMENDIAVSEEKEVAAGTMFETCGGYAPTIGIIGAVLGLIHVMKGLAEGGSTEELGNGIALAFVATVYGVGSANLVFIPFGNKLKFRAAYNRRLRHMMLTGVLGIVQGLHPLIIQEKMRAYYD